MKVMRWKDKILLPSMLSLSNPYKMSAVHTKNEHARQSILWPLLGPEHFAGGIPQAGRLTNLVLTTHPKQLSFFAATRKFLCLTANTRHFLLQEESNAMVDVFTQNLQSKSDRLFLLTVTHLSVRLTVSLLSSKE